MFKNKKWIGTVVVTLLALLLLAASGQAVYRLGYQHGTRSAQSDVMPGAMRLGDMSGYGFGGHKIGGMEDMRAGHQRAGSEHPSQKRGGQQGHQQMFAGHGQSGGRYNNMSSVHSGYGGHGWGGGGITRLLFTMTMLGIFVYVVVKIFQPGGWQLSFGPGQSSDADAVEAKKPVAAAKKTSAKKLK